MRKKRIENMTFTLLTIFTPFGKKTAADGGASIHPLPPLCAQPSRSVSHNSEYPISHAGYPTIDVSYDDYIEYR